MKKFFDLKHYWVNCSVLTGLIFIFCSCATGPGNANGNMGSAEVFMQLKALESEDQLETQDGFQLVLEHFDVSFSVVSLVNHHFTHDVLQDFFGELAEGLAFEVLDIEALPGVEYEQVLLTLGSGLIDEGHSHDEEHLESEDEEDNHEHSESEEIENLSVFIEAEAISALGECHLVFEINDPARVILVAPEGNVIFITRDTVNIISILFNQQGFFEQVTAGADCHSGNEVEVPITEDLLKAFTESFELGESELDGGEVPGDGHGHDHG